MPSFGLVASTSKKFPFRRYHVVSAGFAKTRLHDEVRIIHVLYRSLKQIIGPGTDRDAERLDLYNVMRYKIFGHSASGFLNTRSELAPSVLRGGMVRSQMKRVVSLICMPRRAETFSIRQIFISLVSQKSWSAIL